MLISSLVAIALALLLSWNLFEVVVLYWIQALIIGVFQRRKIDDMVRFYNRVNPEPRANKYRAGSRVILMTTGSAKGFVIIYGLFWLMEGGLLLAMYVSGNGLSLNSFTLLLAVAVLFGSHLFSYRTNRSNDEQRLPSVEFGVLIPLFRMLLPLHIFTVAVGFDNDYGAGGILVWMLLKTAVDLGVHAYEHSQPPVH